MVQPGFLKSGCIVASGGNPTGKHAPSCIQRHLGRCTRPRGLPMHIDEAF